MKKDFISLFITLLFAAAIVALSLWYFQQPEIRYLQGQAEATRINVASKVPGRIKTIYVQEGDTVQKGALLMEMESDEIDARLRQATAARDAALAQLDKANAGTRKELIQSAWNLWQQAKAAAVLAQKTWDRVDNLYKDKVVPAQKKDEAFTRMQAAQQQEQAAFSQYKMAKKGARSEDKQAARALVAKAEAAIEEIESYKRETYVYAPALGEIEEIIPNQGEIVTTGFPVVHLVDLKDIRVIFNIREDKLGRFQMGSKFTAFIPALDNREVMLKVKHMAVQADFATWHATSATGDFDRKTFEVKAYPVSEVENLRPGMSVLVKEETPK